MKTIKTNKAVVDFKGNAIEGSDGVMLTVGNQIANILSIHNENPARCWQLGKAFATEKEVELKAEDVVFLKKAIEQASTGDKRTITAILAGQILEELDSSDKEEVKVEKKK